MLENIRKIIYHNVEKIRKNKGLSQKQLSEKCGFTLSSYKRNKHDNKLTFDNLELMSEGLGIKISELIKSENEESPVDALANVQEEINKILDDKKEALAKK